MSVLSDLLAFVGAVFEQWAVLIGGTAVSVLLSVLEKKYEKTIAWKHYRLLWIGCLGIALFLAWRSEHRGRLTADTDKSVAAAALVTANTEVERLRHQKPERVDNPEVTAKLIEKTNEVTTLRGQLDQLGAKLSTEEGRTRALATEVAQLRTQLRDKRNVQAALKRLATIKEDWDKFLNKAAVVCVKAEIPPTMPEEFRALSRDTRGALADLGYAELQDDFTDSTRCPQFALSSACSKRGTFNEEGVAFFNSSRCRIANLRSIVDRLRAAEANTRP